MLLSHCSQTAAADPEHASRVRKPPEIDGTVGAKPLPIRNGSRQVGTVWTGADQDPPTEGRGACPVPAGGFRSG